MRRSRTFWVYLQEVGSRIRDGEAWCSVRADFDHTTAVEDLPDFLTVEEAAAILRIGRTAAYEQARRYLATGGAEGLPVIRVGRQLRVPRAALEVWAGGPITRPSSSRPSSPTSVTTAIPATSPSRARSRRAGRPAQPSFPFSA